jgi:hypothetical protein
MQCRQIEDVVIVMSRRQPARKIALLMVKDIAQDAEAERIARRLASWLAASRTRSRTASERFA